MNFVVFSRNFYPLNDAEAFCTTRFVSALVEIGHNVHVVTAEYHCDFDYKELLDARVKVTRVRAALGRSRFSKVSIRQQMLLDGDMVNIPMFCRAVKNVLSQYEKPVLVTRALPLTSVIVGFRMRKYAFKWISHFSDAIPWFPFECRLRRVREYLERRWVRKALLSADIVSVTCPLAIRYYKEDYPDETQKTKFIVTTHIGDNKLDQYDSEHQMAVFTSRIVLHPGDMYYGRGENIFEAIDTLNKGGVPCLFVLDRPPWPDMINHFRESANSIAMGIRGGGKLIGRINASADVIYIPDFVRKFDYSPYFMSKFVYQIYGNRPIVVEAKKESCMASYCKKYPEAGLFFAEAGNLSSLVLALKNALTCELTDIRRERIRSEFSAECVARKFERDVLRNCF